ncbi:hypothetical protein ILYODFUR_000434 [Ilyodon furcidens]|uniref:Uncharacterized protein n=1 Tax=Ilyodon furcidens TaxID=33524 RepID=A0ABV0TQQ1_9TELE
MWEGRRHTGAGWKSRCCNANEETWKEEGGERDDMLRRYFTLFKSADMKGAGPPGLEMDTTGESSMVKDCGRDQEMTELCSSATIMMDNDSIAPSKTAISPYKAGEQGNEERLEKIKTQKREVLACQFPLEA